MYFEQNSTRPANGLLVVEPDNFTSPLEQVSEMNVINMTNIFVLILVHATH